MSNTTIDRRKKAEWEAANPVLRFGEPGVESTTNRLKVGDGRTPWNYLPWIGTASSGSTGGGGTGDVTSFQLASAVALLQDKATAATDTELSSAIALVNTTLTTKQDASSAATDTELSGAVSSLNATLGSKQDAANAATDAELASAVATINSALSTKQDASLAATDAEVAAAVATLNTALTGKADLSVEQADKAALQALITANTNAIATNTADIATKQAAATAATDAELAAHAADTTLHAGGKLTGLAVNEGGVSQVVSTTQTAIPSTSVPLAQIANPQVLRGRAQVKCTTAMSATAGTVTTLQLCIVDDAGTLVDAGGLATVDASTTAGYITLFAEWDVPANLAAHTYHLEILRSGSTSGVFTCLNGAIAPGFRSVLRALAA